MSENNPIQEKKSISAVDVLDILKRAVHKAINRKKALGQYAVISENGEIKKIRF